MRTIAQWVFIAGLFYTAAIFRRQVLVGDVDVGWFYAGFIILVLAGILAFLARRAE